jgi:hypothetical protein
LHVAAAIDHRTCTTATDNQTIAYINRAGHILVIFDILTIGRLREIVAEGGIGEYCIAPGYIETATTGGL